MTRRKLAVLLAVLGIGSSLLFLIPLFPQFEGPGVVDQIMAPLVCQSGETLLRRHVTGMTTPRGGTTYTMEVFCVDADGQQRMETEKWGMISVIPSIPLISIAITLFTMGGGRKEKLKLEETEA